jgi:hypothetical protein
MRWLIIIGLLLLSSISIAQPDMFFRKQSKFMMVMDIFKADSIDNQCYDSAMVVWYTDEADTTRFIFKFEEYKYYPVSHNAWQSLSRHSRSEIMRYANRNQVSSKIYLRQNQFNDVYLIKVILIDRGFTFFIVNLNHGIPNYTMSWGVNCNLCN